VNVVDVMDQLAEALDSIDGLRAFAYPPGSVQPPAAVVSWPEVTYDATMARGVDQLLVPVFVLVATVEPRAARAALAPYLAGSGASSVKAALDGGTYTACDVVRVASASVESVTVGGNPYLGAVFSVEIIGTGA
jgi:hypothetical protein